MKAIDESAARGFEDRMLARIQEYFPKHVKAVGEPQLRVLVALALKNARTHVLTTERNVALYLDLMCLLGSSFDADPQMPWAAGILADRSFPTQDARADALHERGWAFAHVVAEDFKDLIDRNDTGRVLGAVREIGRASLEPLPDQVAPQFASELSLKMNFTFPARCAEIGQETALLVVRRAFDTARRYGIHNRRGITLCTALSLVLGAGFDKDPQLPWASRALSSEPSDPSSRTKRLHRDAVESLRQWWGIDGVAEA